MERRVAALVRGQQEMEGRPRKRAPPPPLSLSSALQYRDKQQILSYIASSHFLVPLAVGKPVHATWDIFGHNCTLLFPSLLLAPSTIVVRSKVGADSSDDGRVKVAQSI